MIGFGPEDVTALVLSIQVAAVATLVGLPPAIGLGWLLARRDFFGKTLVDAAVSLPLVLPPVVTGYLLLVLLGRRGVLGAWLHETLGISVMFTWWAAAIAATVVGLPLAVRAIRLSVDAVPRGLEEAGRTLGAGPWRVFFTVTLPLSWPGIVAGATLTFARSLGEFGATLAFAGNVADQTRTLPLMIFTHMQRPEGEAAAWRLVVVSVLVSLAALSVSEWLTRRSRTAPRRAGA